MTIRPYIESDRSKLIALINMLQEHVLNYETHNLYKQMDAFDSSMYADRLLAKTSERNGCIFVAESNGTIIGYIAIVIELHPEKVDYYDHAAGIIEEIVVERSERNSGIGSALVHHAEVFMKNHGCRVSYVDSFFPNVRAHTFYERLGYEGRFINMIKLLS